MCVFLSVCLSISGFQCTVSITCISLFGCLAFSRTLHHCMFVLYNLCIAQSFSTHLSMPPSLPLFIPVHLPFCISVSASLSSSPSALMFTRQSLYFASPIPFLLIAIISSPTSPFPLFFISFPPSLSPSPSALISPRQSLYFASPIPFLLIAIISSPTSP